MEKIGVGIESGIYGNKDMDKKLENLEKLMEEDGRRNKDLGGISRMRVSEILMEKNEGEDAERRSKDRKVNMEGRKLVNFIKRRWIILNGGIKNGGFREGMNVYGRKKKI